MEIYKKKNIIGLKTTIKDALLILKAIIRVTLTTTLSNILLLIKKIKIIIQTLKPIYKTLITLRAIPKNLIIVLLILLLLKYLL